MSFWDTIRRFFGRNRKSAFYADKNGIRLSVGGREPASVAWKDIRQAIAYRLDLFGYDCIAIRFFAEDGSWIDVCEEDYGYEQVIRQMESHLSGILEDWWSKVAFEPFATSWTVIWTRAGLPAQGQAGSTG